MPAEYPETAVSARALQTHVLERLFDAGPAIRRRSAIQTGEE